MRLRRGLRRIRMCGSKILIPPAYAGFATPIFEAFAHPAVTTKETDVAEAVWQAVHDISGQLQFPAGPDAVALFEAAGIMQEMAHPTGFEPVTFRIRNPTSIQLSYGCVLLEESKPRAAISPVEGS